MSSLPEKSSGAKPRLLDLFCGAGGCSVGYHRAGFDAVGVDIKPQPNYPFKFHQADALEFLESGWSDWFDAIHASPPCQAFTTARVIHGREHPDLLTPTRDLLNASGLPWVIENVPRRLAVSHGNRLDDSGRARTSHPTGIHGAHRRLPDGSTRDPGDGRINVHRGDFTSIWRAGTCH